VQDAPNERISNSTNYTVTFFCGNISLVDS